MTTNRKYEKGFEFINEKGLKIRDVIDYYKLVIGRNKNQEKQMIVQDICVIYMIIKVILNVVLY